jgi:transketolase
MRNTFINSLMANVEHREDFFLLSGDAGLGVFCKFKEKFPHKFANMGVAEQNMMGFAAGMAMTGFKVLVYNIIPFLLYRSYEQVRNDICYQDLPVILTGIGSGISYAPQGMTHYSVEDIGLCQTLPNLEVLSPADPIEATLAAQYCLSTGHPVYIRLAKQGEPNIHRETEFDITLPRVVQEGSDVALVFHGSIGEEVVKAGTILAERGISAKVISVPRILPFPRVPLFDLLKGIKQVLVVEEHYQNCGFGSLCAQEWIQNRFPANLEYLGIRGAFIHEIKHQAGMRAFFGISGSHIAKRAQEMCGEKT